ncbi:NAD(P)H-dependent flavin oxidoreductase [Nocardia barduliensis]|uniref:NAD(P)H-dependent flavin oxidoreductase n=1 Tax=Nocardia barduliensis TaxID=2736643 RepID=UPI00157403F7|nr:nitronate monooxygenase family protein [Nocardia barduliensis]
MALPPALAGPLTLPVIGSPLFIASGVDLVTAQCQAGIIGSFPALNARPANMLDEWLREIAERNHAFARDNPGAVVAPFAVNQIVHRSNDRLDHDMAVIAEHRVPIVITSLGARPEINDAVHSYGGIVLHDVTNNHFARKAIDKGADGIIAVAAGAGGHAGTQSPFALVREIREWFDGPLALSGAIAHGNSILAALAAGADFAYIGSAFLSTEEANAVPGYKQMIADSSAADIVYSNLFTGVHGNYLRGSIVAAGLDPDNLPHSDPSAMNFGSTGFDAKAWRDIWGAGQGIGVITAGHSTAELVGRLAEQYDRARRELAQRFTPARSAERTHPVAHSVSGGTLA